MAKKPGDFTPEILDVKVREGDAWSFRVTITGLDLTGGTIVARVKAHDTGAFTDFDQTPEDLAIGRFHVGQAAASVTGRYHIKVTPSGGLPRTWVAGHLRVVET